MKSKAELGETRILQVMITENQRQLHIAEESGNEDLINKYKKNIKHYEKQLNKLE